MSGPPAWMTRLANDVARQMYAADILSPLGCHYYHNQAQDQWEVTVFAARTEIVGGMLDGQSKFSKFNLDLQEMLGLFDEVQQFHWQTADLGPEDDLGPNVSLEGTYRGRSVWLRVLANPPERFEKGRCVHAYNLRLEDVW